MNQAPNMNPDLPGPDLPGPDPALPVLGKVVVAPVLHHCPDCMAILQVLSRHELPADVRLQFVKHVC